MKTMSALLVIVWLTAAGAEAIGQSVVAKVAKVEVPWKAAEPIDLAHGWKKVPTPLQNATAYTASLPGRPQDLPGRDLRFKVLEEGLVFLAVSWSYDGNSGGGWKETSTSEAKLVQAGWQRIGQAVRAENSGKRDDDYVLFCRRLDAGAQVQFHVRKYGAPYVIQPTDDQALAMLKSIGVPVRPAPPVKSTEPERTVAPTPTTHVPTVPATLPADIVRLPPPSAEEQANAKRILAELYGEQLRARTPAARVEVANQLLIDSEAEDLEPSHRYMLLRLAGDLYCSAGNGVGAAAVAQRLCQAFELEELTTCLELLKRAAPNATVPERALGIVEQCLQAIEQAELPEDLETAVGLAEIAESAAVRARQPELRTQARSQLAFLQGYREAYQQFESALKTLAGEPANAEANLIAGRFRCLWDQDWETGLPLLAIGSDPVLKLIAEADLRGPNAAHDEVALGDQWWTRAEKEQGHVQLSMRRRAAYWYELALPNLTGLRRTLLEKRMSELGH